MTPPSDNRTCPPPRATILVADDDGPSGLFLKTAFEDIGCHVTLETDGHAALTRARAHDFDLLMLDCRMPGAGASRILSTLRAEPDAASASTPAIATSAEMDASRQRQLRREGFAGLVIKPITVAALRAIVEPLLPPADTTTGALLDDTAAVRTSGTPEAVTALRGLLARDLRQLINDLDTLSDTPLELGGQLHRLIASCGFCGTPALAEASRSLKNRINEGHQPSLSELECFRMTLTRTLSALDG
ncbi:MAG TPA: response regulator [Oleiagrimonas sp.]|nr:response regulator [Oleiagrimonas sp.]